MTVSSSSTHPVIPRPQAEGPLEPHEGASLLAPGQALDDGIELVEVADFEREQALLAQPAQLELGLQAQRLLDALFERAGVGAFRRLRPRCAAFAFALEVAAQALEGAHRELLLERAL